MTLMLNQAEQMEKTGEVRNKKSRTLLMSRIMRNTATKANVGSGLQQHEGTPNFLCKLSSKGRLLV